MNTHRRITAAAMVALAWLAGCSAGETNARPALSVLRQLPDPSDPSGADLLRGLDEEGSTRTYVGNELNRNFLDYDGDPLVIDTMITAVKFCVGGERSDATGGLSDAPTTPLRFVRNGVAYDEWTLLVSGIGFHGLADTGQPNPYAHYVFGPIDSNGVDQSHTAKHAREGLAWIPVRVAVPASGWNGRLIVFLEGGSYPGSDTAWLLSQDVAEVPVIDLLARGWAFCTYQQFGLVRKQQNPWAADGSYWSAGRNLNTLSWCRARARIDGDGNETPIRINALRDIDDKPGVSGKPDKDGIYVVSQADATLARNVTNVVKNLLEDRLGARPTTTIFGRTWGSVMPLNHGRIVEAIDPDPDNPCPQVKHPQVDENGLTARSGGNYNTPYDPSSGLVFNAFFVINGSGGGGLVDPDDDIHALVVDPEFPVTAPEIILGSLYDNTTRATAGLRWAHALGVALQRSTVHPSVPDDLNDVLRIYHLQGVNHSISGSLYAFSFADRGSRWYEGGENGIGMNTSGKGRRLNYVTDLLPFVNLPASTHFASLEPAYNKPRAYPFYARLQTLLAEWAEGKGAPPKSHLDAYLMANASTSTILPPLPLAPSPCQDDILDVNCWKSGGPIVEDCLVPALGGFSTTIPQALSQRTVDAIAYLKNSGALKFTTKPIQFPEFAARLGLFVVDRQATVLSPFTADELKNGYTDPNGNHYAGYENKADYVARVAEVADDLVERGLFDEKLAERLVQEVAESNYPR